MSSALVVVTAVTTALQQQEAAAEAADATADVTAASADVSDAGEAEAATAESSDVGEAEGGAILSNAEVQVPKVSITEAVAIQIFTLVVEEKCFSMQNSAAVYVLLASLSHGARVAPNSAAAKRLWTILARNTQDKPLGLVPAMKLAVRRRSGDRRLANLSAEAAMAHLLTCAVASLNFDFGVVAAGGGGGGGDPGDDPSAPTTLRADATPSAWRRHGCGLDVRTRALDGCLVGLAHAARRAAEASGEPLSEWACKGGALPLDVLVLIDERVRAVPLR